VSGKCLGGFRWLALTVSVFEFFSFDNDGIPGGLARRPGISVPPPHAFRRGIRMHTALEIFMEGVPEALPG